MRNYFALVAAALALPLFGSFEMIRPPTATAQVTVRGTVEYWDRLDRTYRPARQVQVRVRGDWLRPDPWVETDDQGRYEATIPNPWGWGDYDNVRIQVFAETPGLIQVFGSMLAPRPYSAVSHPHDDVGDDQTQVINLRIAGPSNNARRTPYRDSWQTANAFMVHQEMLEHHRSLLPLAFTANDFFDPHRAHGSAKVIVPAAGVPGTAYFNHTTGLINLVLADATGTGDWRQIEAMPDDPYLPGHHFFRTLVRHEYSHAIHHNMTPGIPAGLWQPANHSVETESNQSLALTEGFAGFLPLVSFGLGGAFEGTNALSIPPANPPGGHHTWEGEFAALLWDIHDPVGREELRHPAVRTENGGHLVPQEILDDQFWTDRLEDPNLVRIRRVLRTASNVGPALRLEVHTVPEFLHHYLLLYPQDVHALKAAAFNRDITRPALPEHPAHLADELRITRSGRRLYLKFEVIEPDPEDRSFVTVSLWHHPDGGTPSRVHELTLERGWSGDRREVELIRSLSGNVQHFDDDVLWILVNDEMLPTVYRFAMPEDNELWREWLTREHDLSAHELNAQQRADLDPAIARDLPQIDRDALREAARALDVRAAGETEGRSTESTGGRLALAERTLSRDQALERDASVLVRPLGRERPLHIDAARLRRHTLDADQVREVQDLIERARQVLAQYEENRELFHQQQSALYGLAQRNGLNAAPRAADLFRREAEIELSAGQIRRSPRLQDPRARLSARQRAAIDTYRAWLERAGTGEVVLDPSVRATAGELLLTQRERLQAAVREQESVPGAITQLQRQLSAAIERMDFGPHQVMIEADLRRVLESLAAARETIAEDRGLLPGLREQEAVLGALSRS